MKIRKDIAISETGFVFNPSSGESYTVNNIGIELFNYLKEEKSYEEIRDLILEKYDATEAIFEKDYQDFIAILGNNNLLEN
ncbi:MAG: PqqD family protein [Bacteroidetes bacterium]|nr:MAG: PqqD family protein [Bacteroidota bacterium]